MLGLLLVIVVLLFLHLVVSLLELLSWIAVFLSARVAVLEVRQSPAVCHSRATTRRVRVVQISIRQAVDDVNVLGEVTRAVLLLPMVFLHRVWLVEAWFVVVPVSPWRVLLFLIVARMMFFCEVPASGVAPIAASVHGTEVHCHHGYGTWLRCCLRLGLAPTEVSPQWAELLSHWAGLALQKEVWFKGVHRLAEGRVDHLMDLSEPCRPQSVLPLVLQERLGFTGDYKTFSSRLHIAPPCAFFTLPRWSET